MPQCVTRMKPYLKVATRHGRAGTEQAGRIRRGLSARADRAQSQAIRDWASENGYDVSDHSRIPTSVVDAYHSR